ncbi:hypothetical protein B0J14DRAFT_602264 [Halenospora varia]|nr:hypothetical protein B0J14DRAFT_602264 [Halenospora varia]
MASPANTRTIAIFGATGQTGRVVVRQLSAQAESNALQLQIYVRTKAKLVDLFPDIDTKSHVRIFEGALTDVEVVRNTLAGAQIIVCTLGENKNLPGVRVQRDGADSIVAALKDHKAQQEGWEKPHIFYLSSSTYNARFAAARPPLVHWLIETAFSHPYADLVKAQTKLVEYSSLLSITLIQPPVLIEEDGTGHEISTEFVRLAVSYEDLGSGFVEMILEDQYQELPAVGVSSKLGDRPMRYAPEIFRRIFWGLLAQIKSVVFEGGDKVREQS